MTAATGAIPLLIHSSAGSALTYSPSLGRTVKLMTLAVVTMATSMEFLTSYAVGVAQPDIQGELAASRDEGTWILTTYTTCWLIGLVLSNWLAARIGYRRHMMTAVVVFMFSAIGCGMSHSLAQMLIFRCLMGFAGGSFLVRGQTAIYLTFLGKDRFNALLVFGMGAVCIARLCGAAVGGYLTEWHTWRAVFLLNVPFALAILVVLAALPDFKARLPKDAQHLDMVGLALLIAWIAPLQLALSRGQRDEWFSDPFITAMVAITIMCLPLFVWWELRSGNTAPIISLRAYRSRNFVFGSMYVVLMGMMLYGQLYVVPQFLRFVQLHSAWGTGLLQSFNATAFAVGLIFAPFVMVPMGLRVTLAVGAAAFAAGMWCWADRLTPQISDAAMLLPLALTGFGAGWQIGPLSTLINRDTPPLLMGEGMELYLCQRQLGGSWGIALLSILVDWRESFWSARLGEHLNDFNIANHISGNALNQGAAALQATGLPQADAMEGAIVLLHARLVTQATVNAFADTFQYQAILGIVAIALILFLSPVRTLTDAMRVALRNGMQWMVELLR